MVIKNIFFCFPKYENEKKNVGSSSPPTLQHFRIETIRFAQLKIPVEFQMLSLLQCARHGQRWFISPGGIRVESGCEREIGVAQVNITRQTTNL